MTTGHAQVSNLVMYGTKYSRMEQVKIVEGSY